MKFITLKSVNTDFLAILFAAIILFLMIACVYSFLMTPSENFTITQNFETTGSDAFVRYDISVSDPSYLPFPYEITYQWNPYTPSRIDRENTSLSAVYMNPDGRLTTKKIPVEYDHMSFDRIVTQVPSKSDGGRLIKITGSVCIHQPAGPDAISFVQIKPTAGSFGIVSFNPRSADDSMSQSYIVFEFDR